ncbi:MAG: hypothetical protein HDS68_02750 [Bacteroidales bacterium]|nr:hypothetical protein [Bacteroidales bacterium]
MATDNNNRDFNNPAGETLNERLRRAAAMARGEHPSIQQPPREQERPAAPRDQRPPVQPRPQQPQERSSAYREPDQQPAGTGYPRRETPVRETPRTAAPTIQERAQQERADRQRPAERRYDDVEQFRRSMERNRHEEPRQQRQTSPEPRDDYYRNEPPRRPAQSGGNGGYGGGNGARRYYSDQEPPRHRDKKQTTKLVTILAVLLLLAVLAVVFLTVSHTREAAEQQQQIEQLQLANEQIQLANEYDALNNEFAQYENQTSLLANDSIVQKYSAARAQVEKLLQELKNEKNKSAAQISKLKDEITTLKGILRNYVEQINALSQENQELRTENQQMRARNQQLSQNIQSVQQSNKVLSERMTLAEKLNVTGLSLTPLNKKGRTEKNVTKARQLMVTFTIPQNNSTPVGEKTIYLRITNPEGTLLGGGGTFTFEDASLEATARKAIEYAGEEIPGVNIYWDVNTTLTPGDYTVELFADNYRLASRKFTLKK